MRVPSRVVYRLVLIAALTTVFAAARPDTGLQAAALDGLPRLDTTLTSIPPAPWEAVAASGRVEARSSGSGEEAWARVRQGDGVEPESTIRTASRASATITRNRDVILVSGATEIVLPEASADSSRILHNQGNAFYEIHPRPRTPFEVVTPYLVITAEGTAFTVIVQEEYTAVSVSDGHVRVHATFTGERADLRTGDMALMTGPMDRMDLQQDPPEGLLPILRNDSKFVYESRIQSGRLARNAAEDECGAPILYDFDSGTYLDSGDEVMARWFTELDEAWESPVAAPPIDEVTIEARRADPETDTTDPGLER